MSTNLPDATNGSTGLGDANVTPGQQLTNLVAIRNFIADLFGTATSALRTVWEAFRLHGGETLANGSATFAVGSNALTIAAKTRAGATPSATDPILIGQRSATAGAGDFNLRAVTAALSLTVSSGSTLGLGASDNSPLFVYLLDNAGTAELAISQVWLGPSGIVSTTAEGGAGGADAADVVYSANARSNVPFRAWLRLEAPQTAAGTWAAVPTKCQPWPFDPFDRNTGPVIVDVQNVSGVGQVDIVKGFSALYDRTSVEVIDYVPATNSTDLHLLVSEDGGSTFKTGASDYAHQRTAQTDGGAVSGAGAGTDSKIVLISGVSNASGKTVTGEFTITNPSGTSRNKQIRGSFDSNGGSWGIYTTTPRATYLGSTNPINGLRLKSSSGNMSAKIVTRAWRKYS